MFYYKENCHLCEQMSGQLQSFLSGPGSEFDVSVVERDIEDNDKWYSRYREYVPVLVVNGEEVCHYFFDSDDLLEALSGNKAGNTQL